MNRLAYCVAMSLAVMSAPCIAQELAGPKVDAASAAPSLVARDFSGTITRLESSPEEAAIPLLTLSPQETTLVETAFNERAAIFDRAVSENYELVLKLQGFREAKPAERLAMLREWNTALRELKVRGKLVDEISAALSKENAAAFRKLVTDYREALIAQAMKGSEMMGERPLNRQQAQGREVLIELGQEVKRAFDRRIAEGKTKIEEVVKTIDATPEQREQLEKISLDFAQQSLGKPTAAQRSALIRRIFDVLTPEQRKKLAAAYLEKK